ncbi:unnamed protein product [Haemonchus placei]|uniref:LRRNT_2 domain-containing protein n=1 Tax=Haemonchus placei TaxID=6290 RepID=A0A0N4W337_HAEPC|nr:unnamed protein product [Haemonchus placei]
MACHRANGWILKHEFEEFRKIVCLANGWTGVDCHDRTSTADRTNHWGYCERPGMDSDIADVRLCLILNAQCIAAGISLNHFT